MARTRQYPHLDGVTDWQARQSLRLLWDRVFDQADGIDAANTTILAQASTIAALSASLSTLQTKVTKLAIVAPGSGAGTDPDAGIDLIDTGTVSGPFANGPIAATFAGLGVVQIFSSPDVSGWAETSVFTRLSFAPGVLTINHSLLGQWPPVNIGAGTLQEATIWMFFNIGGTWYGAGAERLRPAQTVKLQSPNYSQWPADWWYSSRWGALSTLTPFAGQPAAALITSGSTRVDNRTIVQERTNLLLFSWPADGISVSFP